MNEPAVRRDGLQTFQLAYRGLALLSLVAMLGHGALAGVGVGYGIAMNFMAWLFLVAPLAGLLEVVVGAVLYFRRR